MSKCAVCGKSHVKLWRGYGSFFREDDVYCTEHKPEQWYVPLVKDADGSVWGYTSAPDEAVKHWEALPDA